MALKITHDSNAPTAAVELTIKQPLADYDLEEIEAAVPRDVDPILASQGFKDLLDEARSILDSTLRGAGFEIAQLTGAICADGGIFRPGIWLVLRESGAPTGQAMSAEARQRVTASVEELRTRLGLAETNLASQ